jgi:hypothetical protein
MEVLTVYYDVKIFLADVHYRSHEWEVFGAEVCEEKQLVRFSQYDGSEDVALALSLALSCLVRFYMESGIYNFAKTSYDGRRAVLIAENDDKYAHKIISVIPEWADENILDFSGQCSYAKKIFYSLY